MKRIILISFLFNLTFLAGLLAQSTDDFVTTWKTDNPGSSNSTSITIPTFSGETYSYDVDWDNDGTFDEFGLTGDAPHDFVTAGTYTIRIQGTFPRIYFNNDGDKQKLLSVDQWGTIAWTSMGSAFYGCSNLAVNATDAPDLSGATDLTDMFRVASSFNQSINNWDVSTITNMQGMFASCAAFNQPLNNWNTGAVTNMLSMFKGTTTFNQDIGGWNTSNVTNMYQMFFGAGSFNQDISGWDVSSVSSMTSMFAGATSFNQDIGGWDVAGATLTGMFGGASSFNQDISGWTVGGDLSFMFDNATSFNQPIGSWNTSGVTKMGNMFRNATSFDQNLSNWNITGISDLNYGLNLMFSGVTLSTANYDAILISWSQQNVSSNLTFSGGNSQYCAGAAARGILTLNKNWTVTDGGYETSCSTPDQFTTTWKTDNPGTSNSTSILIPTFSGETYNYFVDWGDGNYGWFTGDATHDYGSAGTYQVKISGTFPRIYFNNGSDKQKLLSVDQWGTIAWTSMENAFYGCSNLAVNATDAPDLSGVTDLSRMFDGASSFNQDINNWDVSTITNMRRMFALCTSFNQPLSNWNTGAVTDMLGMFKGASTFNQDIGGWNTSNVTIMYELFYGASSFNQDISGWVVSSVSSMTSMFAGASSFNQDIGGWNVGGATLTGMFGGASSFNQDISGWTVGGDLSFMFDNATSFNQPIGSWNTSGVTKMGSMFTNATSFNQNLSSWNVSGVNNFQGMFAGVTLSTANYDALLISWSQQNVANSMIFNGGNSQYCAGATAHQSLIDNHNWTITDGGQYCPSEHFVTTWQTDNPGTSSSTSITIPTYSGETYSYDVDWENDGVFDDFGLTGDAMHDYGAAGTYQVRIRGTFPRIYFNDGGDKQKLLSVDQWGTIAWTSMERAFYGCSNLVVNATDAPDLSGVTDLSYMFAGATSFNQNINNWDVSTVTKMFRTFRNCTSFNQPLSNWNTASVTDMSAMFSGASSFNGDIGGWNTSSVTNMHQMFEGATVFNQDIGGWDVSNMFDVSRMFTNASSFNQDIGGWDLDPVYMYGMFRGASSFNQPIGNWDTYTVGDMSYMFFGAISFDQDLSNWNIPSVSQINNMFDGVTLSTANYDAILISWSQQNVHDNLSFSGGNSQYCAGAAGRQSLIDNHNWTITDGGLDCPSDHFVTTWKTDNPGASNSTSITIPTAGVGYNYDVDWDNDGFFDETGLNGSTTHDFGTAGTYTIRIRGSFPRIFFANGGDKEKILSVDQWGDISWTSMFLAFYGCNNLAINAPDAPDLSGVSNMINMFGSCTSLNSSLNSWDVSNVTNFTSMFKDATAFNGDISSWVINTSTNITMSSMFNGATSFNQNIGNWDVSNVTGMNGMFAGATSFNQNIGSWDVSSVNSMVGMFDGATTFNQDIGSWDMSNVNYIAGMFAGATAFNQDIGSWVVSGVNAPSGMDDMFNGATAFNQNISSWNVGPVTSMADMFSGATAFNQDISGWNVANVTDMSNMFNGASSFDQDLGGWNVSNVSNMTDMFNGVTLTTANYDALLIGWSQLSVQANVVFSGGNSQFCDGVVARGTLTLGSNWTITDGGIDTACPTTNLFITTWKTDNPGTSNSTSILIPTYSGETYNYFVEWGDGSYGSFDGDATHDYGTAGSYQVKITGDFPRIYFNNAGDKQKLLSVDQWGAIAWTSMEYSFNGCINLTIDAADAPDFSGANNTHNMFFNCTQLGASTTNFNNWDVSTIFYMRGMFYGSGFDNDISGWNVGNVVDMREVFQSTSFNQDISGWSVSNVSNFDGLFLNNPSFNQDIGGWDVSNVNNMKQMFQGATAFNQDITNWDVSSCTVIYSMFKGATSFNQNIGNWNVSNVNTMASMFEGATAFNQDISSWDVGNVTNMTDMFNGVTLSTGNYDALLMGWNTLDPGETQIPSNLTFNAGSSYYCDGNSARQSLIDTYGWTITDAGEDPTCLVLPVELVSFSGTVRENLNHLTWVTASEENARAFEIERSENDGRDWAVIGAVEAMGNTTADQSYRYDDMNPPARAYYRLRIIDLDGSFEFSDVIFLENASQLDEPIRVYPNPTSGTLHIQWPAPEGFHARLFDATGQLLLSANNPESFELSALPAGIYLLQVSDHRGQPVARKRVVKQ